MIHELLNHGRESAIPARDLIKTLDVNTRTFYSILEQERRAGFPICASKQEPVGLYLPATRDELDSYCKMLDNTAKSIRKTRRACMKAAEKVEV